MRQCLKLLKELADAFRDVSEVIAALDALNRGDISYNEAADRVRSKTSDPQHYVNLLNRLRLEAL